MNQKFIQSVVLSSLLVGSLTFANFNAIAAGFNKKVSSHGDIMTSEQFYQKLENTEPGALAKTFGMPDNISTLRSLHGDSIGVVWVYRDAVSAKTQTMDANFVLVKGDFKYVTLSKSS